MTLTHNIAQKTLKQNAIAMIRRGLALIAIDPRTGTLPDKDYTDPEEYDELWLSASEVHEILDVLAEYVGEAPCNLFEGGDDCCNDSVVYDALLLAEACTREPSYQTIGDMQEYAEEVFCQINFIEHPSEYAA